MTFAVQFPASQQLFPALWEIFSPIQTKLKYIFLAMGKMNVLPFSTLKYLYWYIHNIYFLLTKEKLKDANVCCKWWNYRFTVSSIFSLFTTNLFYDSGPCIQNSRPEFPKNWWKSATHIWPLCKSSATLFSISLSLINYTALSLARGITRTLFKFSIE